MLRALSCSALFLTLAVTLSAQVRLVYEVGGRKLPVTRFDDEGAPCYQEGGKLKHLPEGGIYRLETGGTYSDRELEFHTNYQVMPPVDSASGPGHVLTYAIMRPKWRSDPPGYFYAAAWDVRGETRQIQVRPAKFFVSALFESLRMSMKLQPGEEIGFLRLYFFDEEGRCLSGVKSRPPELREFRAALDAGDRVRLAAWCERYATTRALPGELLFQLIRLGDIPTLKAVLKGKTRPNVLDDNGYSALQVAAQMGNLPATEALLQAGARVDEGPVTALYFAADRNALDVAQVLLWAGAKPGAASSEGSNPVSRAISQGYAEMATMLLAAESKPPPQAMLNRWLHLAMANRSAPLLSLLLERGADPGALSDESYTRVIMAERNGAAFMQVLSGPIARVDTWSPDAITPLMNAAMRGFDEGVALLLRAGANPVAMDKNGRTAAAHAAAWAPVQYRRVVVQRLLQASRHAPPQLSAMLAAALAQGCDGNLADWLVQEHGATFDMQNQDMGFLVRRAVESGGATACRQAVVQGFSPEHKLEGDWTFAALAEYYGYGEVLAAMTAKLGEKPDTSPPPVTRERIKAVSMASGWFPKHIQLAEGPIEAEVEVLLTPEGKVHFPCARKATPAELAPHAIKRVMQLKFSAASEKNGWRRVTVPVVCSREPSNGKPKS